MHERVETEAAKVGKKREGKRRRESEVRSAAAATERELRKRKSSSGEKGKTNLVQTASALRPPGKSAS